MSKTSMQLAVHAVFTAFRDHALPKAPWFSTKTPPLARRLWGGVASPKVSQRRKKDLDLGEFTQHAAQFSDRETMKSLALLFTISSLLVTTTTLAAPHEPVAHGESIDTPAPAEIPGNPPEPSPALGVKDRPISAEAASSTRPDPWRPGTVVLYGHFAILGGPAGVLGGSLEVAVLPELAVEIGAGAGNGGPQFALNLWLKTFRDLGGSFDIGAGMSAGQYAPLQVHLFSMEEDNSTPAPSVMTVWANGQIGWEYLYKSGLRVRPYVGLSRQISQNPCFSSCSQSDKTTLPFVGIQIGGAFGQ